MLIIKKLSEFVENNTSPVFDDAAIRIFPAYSGNLVHNDFADKNIQ
jgi:hypothetical protein